MDGGYCYVSQISHTGKALLQSGAQGADINEKDHFGCGKTIKNCGLKVTEVNLIARTTAMCNAGFELYRSGFMIPPGRPR